MDELRAHSRLTRTFEENGNPRLSGGKNKPSLSGLGIPSPGVHTVGERYQGIEAMLLLTPTLRSPHRGKKMTHGSRAIPSLSSTTIIWGFSHGASHPSGTPSF